MKKHRKLVSLLLALCLLLGMSGYALAASYTGSAVVPGLSGIKPEDSLTLPRNTVWATLTASWGVRVNFVDWDETELKTDLVPVTDAIPGSSSAPEDPTRSGYTFTGWERHDTNGDTNVTLNPDGSVTNVTGPGPIVYIATYEKDQTADVEDPVIPPVIPTPAGTCELKIRNVTVLAADGTDSGYVQLTDKNGVPLDAEAVETNFENEAVRVRFWPNEEAGYTYADSFIVKYWEDGEDLNDAPHEITVSGYIGDDGKPITGISPYREAAEAKEEAAKQTEPVVQTEAVRKVVVASQAVVTTGAAITSQATVSTQGAISTQTEVEEEPEPIVDTEDETDEFFEVYGELMDRFPMLEICQGSVIIDFDKLSDGMPLRTIVDVSFMKIHNSGVLPPGGEDPVDPTPTPPGGDPVDPTPTPPGGDPTDPTPTPPGGDPVVPTPTPSGDDPVVPTPTPSGDDSIPTPPSGHSEEENLDDAFSANEGESETEFSEEEELEESFAALRQTGLDYAIIVTLLLAGLAAMVSGLVIRRKRRDA